MKSQNNFSEYFCDDYLKSDFVNKGFWSEVEQIWLIVPHTEIQELFDHTGNSLEFLEIGRPGVDDISFGYRKRKKGIWAYHPITNEFQYLSLTISDFLDGWLSGQIKV